MPAITQEQLENAAVDADTLERVLNDAATQANPGHEEGTVTSRLGRTYKNIARAIIDATAKPYQTWAGGLAAATVANGLYAQVLPEDTGNHPSLAGDFGASGGNTPNEGFYKAVEGTGWVRIGNSQAGLSSIAAALSQAWAQSATAPDPLDPTSKSAKTWAELAASVVGGLFLTGYTAARSGWSHVFIDSARRVMFGISSRTGQLISNIPARFNEAVTFVKSANVSAGLAMASRVVTFPVVTGFRSGWRVVALDSQSRILAGVKNNNRVQILGQDMATLADIGAGIGLGPEAGVAEAIGDSLTAGFSQTPYPQQLAALIGGGFVANNKGIGSQKSTQIAMRVGAKPIYLTLTGNALPAGGTPVAVTAINGVALGTQGSALSPDPRWLSQSTGGTVRTQTGYIAGNHVTVTRSVDGSNNEVYSVVGDSGQSGANVPAGTLFVPDDALTVPTRELWVEVGRNNYDQADTVMDDIAAIINFYRPTVKRILLFDVLNAQSETRGTAQWQAIVNLNNRIRAMWPQYYVADPQGRGWREVLVAAGRVSDPSDFANDVTPTSLRITSDPLHCNTAGYAVQSAYAYAYRQLRYPGA